MVRCQPEGIFIFFLLCNIECAPRSPFLTNSLLASPPVPPAQLAICICMGFANAINTTREAGAGARARPGLHLEPQSRLLGPYFEVQNSLKNKQENLGEKTRWCNSQGHEGFS